MMDHPTVPFPCLSVGVPTRSGPFALPDLQLHCVCPWCTTDEAEAALEMARKTDHTADLQSLEVQRPDPVCLAPCHALVLPPSHVEGVEDSCRYALLLHPALCPCASIAALHRACWRDRSRVFAGTESTKTG
ncbi:hypothetical protein NDU88_007647 [Pleurodeles waltl]|uniref:Uncharacterized protein n=1 Tax=Pleurodeles waltl TaxID=8319 RepID=A0AAV7U0N6_PLEWA|nr:hypothetical protein NDU88_007647 [Pleurodeles waltl]